MNGFSFEHDATGNELRSGSNGCRFSQLDIGRACSRSLPHTGSRPSLRYRGCPPVSALHSRAADFDQRVEHGLQIEGRATDDLEHVGGGGLLLQRFAQLVEQPGVLDGDDGLGGEIGHQLDLLVGERADLLR